MDFGARARIAVALAQRTNRASSDALLVEAERLARSIARERIPFAAPMSELLVAGVLSVRGCQM